MQITVVGDEIRVDVVTVGLIQGGPRKERESFRAALKSAPDMIYEDGSGSFVDDNLQDKLDRCEQECEELQDDLGIAEGALEAAEDEANDLRAAIENAIDELKNENPAEALEILGKALDA